MIEAIAAVWLPVSNVERAVDFYGDELGLDVEQQDDGWAIVTAGHVRIGLSDSLDPGEGGAIVAFAVSDDLEEAAEQLPDASEVVELPWARVINFHDPDGNPLQLYEPADE
jgi:catechol 2,3-dioxygenase-like lactoylglutathione lyase family enzyme